MVVIFILILATCYSLLDTDSMSVGLLIITHERIGADLLNTAIALLGVRPLNAQVLGVPLDSDPDQAVDAARQRISRLDLGDGVLVLTDLFGSTPCNIATRLQSDGRVVVVAGVNLPMLIRVLNYPRLSLPELVQKAISGGSDGVLLCRSNFEEHHGA